MRPRPLEPHCARMCYPPLFDGGMDFIFWEVDPPVEVADPPLRVKKSIYMGGWVVGSVEDGAHGGEGAGAAHWVVE